MDFWQPCLQVKRRILSRTVTEWNLLGSGWIPLTVILVLSMIYVGGGVVCPLEDTFY